VPGCHAEQEHGGSNEARAPFAIFASMGAVPLGFVVPLTGIICL